MPVPCPSPAATTPTSSQGRGADAAAQADTCGLDARLFSAVLCALLTGYAVMGRGFAYMGIKPLYVGELTLLIGLLTVGLRPRVWNVLRTPLGLSVTALMAWGATRAVPFLEQYKVDVLRDAVVWGYALFALLVAGTVMAWPGLLGALLRRYLWFAAAFPIAMAVLWPSQRVFWEALPRWPAFFGGGQPLIMNKPGDIYVQLAGICAFLAAGCFGRVNPISGLAIAATAVLAASGRGGMLAFAVAVTVALLCRKPSRTVEKVLLVGGLSFVLLAGSGVSLTFPGAGRDISARDITLQMTSIVSDNEDASLDATKQWRLRWWEKINAGVFCGEHFWGRGYGINLARADGFEDHGVHKGLRSPHSIHMTMLARGGVVGILLWAGVNLLWAGSIITGLVRAKRWRHRAWAGLFSWLLAYWCALLINGSFDVFLEGPMGGIWFWSVFGLGIAACETYRQRPGLLDGPRQSPPPDHAGTRRPQQHTRTTPQEA